MEMHDVVEMLLNRMKDYPEDFVSVESVMVYRETNKWERALRLVYEVADQHEKDALDIRTQEAKRAVYMGAALKTMLDDEPKEEKLTMSTANRYSVFGQPQIMPQGSITTTNTNITTASLITELEARQKAIEAQMKRQYALSEYSNSFSIDGDPQ